MYTLIVITPESYTLKMYDTEKSFFCWVVYILIAHSEMMNTFDPQNPIICI